MRSELREVYWTIEHDKIQAFDGIYLLSQQFEKIADELTLMKELQFKMAELLP